MLKKKLNIILILVVLGLWGTIGYKSINGFFPSKEIVNEDLSNNNISFNKIIKDSFQLVKLNRDPFLDKALIEKKAFVLHRMINVEPKKNSVKNPVKKFKTEIIWPQVFYYGYIKSQQKTEELILVKIDNNLLKVRKNQNIDGLVIKRIFKDSIEVSFNKEKKIVRKN